MVSAKILFSFCAFLGIALQVDCQDLALSTSLYNNLAEIFQNTYDVNWRALQALFNTCADTLGLGANVVGKLSKTAGTTVDYANRGLGYAKDYTGRSLNYLATGLQTGVGYLSSQLNSLGATAENYGRRLVGGNKSSSRRRK